MSLPIQNELASFQQFIVQQLMNSSRASLSPEEALDLWREQHPGPEEDVETVEALREALADFNAGDRGVSFEDFDREFRKNHDLDRQS
jgi:hypothetical protein